VSVGTTGVGSPALLLAPPVDVSTPEVSVPHRMKITAWLWLGHTSEFTNQKLSGGVIHLLLGVCHSNCFWICISSWHLQLHFEVSSLGVRVKLWVCSHRLTECSGELAPALKSSVLRLLDGDVSALTPSLDLRVGPTELCVLP